MITCKECKFWKKAQRNYFNKIYEGSYGDCSNNSFSYEEPQDGRTDMLIYSDYEGYYADFNTGKDFGCIHGIKI